MNLTPEERDEYQRTGRLPAREQERIAREGIERTREANERAANRDPRKDPTLRDSVYLPSVGHSLADDFRLVRNGMGISDLKRRAAIDRIEEQYEELQEQYENLRKEQRREETR